MEKTTFKKASTSSLNIYEMKTTKLYERVHVNELDLICCSVCETKVGMVPKNRETMARNTIRSN
jgi:hypothetical protein